MALAPGGIGDRGKQSTSKRLDGPFRVAWLKALRHKRLAALKRLESRLSNFM
jgi:hypothetical protein